MSGKDIGHINVNVSPGAVYAAAMQRVIEFKAVLRRISGDPHAFKVTSLTRPPPVLMTVFMNVFSTEKSRFQGKSSI